LRYLEGTIDKVYWNILTNKTRIFPVNSNNELYTPEVLYGELYTDIVENCIIPDIYLTGSIEQRWELLQGIMDCCGTISNDNNVFCTIKTKDLKDSILRLTYSLGLIVTVMGDEDGEDYGLLFKTNNDLIKRLFKNSRFLHKPLPPYNNSIDVTRMAITSIEKEEEQREMVCFMVNNPEHLFLCNDYIVTHNTTSSRLFAKALNCRHLKENDICGECDVCKADLDNVPWYTEFDSTAMGNVDSIRELRDIFTTTAKGYNKVIVLDECLDYDQRILCKYKGDIKLIDIGFIVNQKLPVEVLSYNFNTEIFEWKVVTGWHKNSKKPVITREFRREDNKRTYSLTSSENHRVFRPNGEEVFVKDLIEGDNIVVCKTSLQKSVLERESRRISEYIIPSEAEQIILGTLLGDSSMSLSSGGIPRLIIKQGIQQSLYYYDKREILGDLFSSEYISDNHAGWGKPVLVCNSKNRRELLPIYKLVYNNGRKMITKELLNSLTPLSLAVWYMDDGSLLSKDSSRKGSVHLSTYSFSKEENELIISYIKEKFGITFILQKDTRGRGKGWSLRANVEDSNKFLTLISEFVPDYFNYKLQDSINTGSLKNIPSIYYLKKESPAIFSIATYIGKSKEKPCHGGYTYDLTVEDNHNYIANGVLVHNCHTISRVGQAALLKVFEETPRGVYFLLPTTDPDKLLPTIRSRSLELIYTAKSSKEVKDDINKHAIELGLSLSQSTLDVIATRSRGIMRNAHMLLDKVNLIGEEEFLKSDIPTTSLLNNFITAILKTDRILVLDTVSELSRIPVAYLKDDWQEYFLNLMKASVDPDLVQDERIKKLATALGKQTVNIVKFCIQDWIIRSFQNSTQAQTAMLAIYQSLSKEQK
jgi:DNA polymerase III gamma/tau subunit